MAISNLGKRKGAKSLTIHKVFPFLSIALILLGAGMLFAASFDTIASNSDFNSSQIPDRNEVVQTPVKPAKIYVTKLGRTLDISDGTVVDNRWTISTTGVSYLTTSGDLGGVGNVVLYGHNTKAVLGGLWKVQNGDIVEITGIDGKVYKYEIFERREVKPNQVEILNHTEDSRLTIFTCSGFLDSARFVVVGKLVS